MDFQNIQLRLSLFLSGSMKALWVINYVLKHMPILPISRFQTDCVDLLNDVRALLRMVKFLYYVILKLARFIQLTFNHESTICIFIF